MSALQGGEGAEAAVLLPDHRVHREGGHPAHVGSEGSHPAEDGGHPTLHVAGAAAQHPAVDQLSRKRIRRPAVQVTRRHHVEVALQDEPDVLAGTVDSDQTPGMPPFDLLTRIARRGPKRRQVERPQVDGQAQALQHPGQLRWDRGLGCTTAHARRGDQSSEQVDDVPGCSPHRAPLALPQHGNGSGSEGPTGY